MAELHVVKREPVVNDSVVHMLEDALERAKAGDVESAAVAVVYHDGQAQSAFGDSDNMPALVGCTTGLLHCLVQAMRGED